ncbi:MAG: iron-sulfur cluster repair di-iron protein [Flavobacteriales bacterium]|nr:iron-sulfur cluster repair di-iron protein [Flavobacteriales bacterium]
MENIKNKTVADIVTENINTAHIFKKYGIDFCCGGGVSIEKACEKKNVDYDTLFSELQSVDAPKESYNYDKWALDFLVDHIINIHHTYVKEAIPLIYQYVDRVAKVHGHHYKQVVEIQKLFYQVADELELHMRKEEQVLFPYIKELVDTIKSGEPVSPSPFGTIDNPIRMMMMEHDVAGDIMKKINELAENYNPPAEACNTFRALYAKLDEFEQDLHHHIHLENNILFPKAAELEA